MKRDNSAIRKALCCSVVRGQEMLKRLCIVGIGCALAFSIGEAAVRTGIGGVSDLEKMRQFDRLLRGSPDEPLSYEHRPRVVRTIDGVAYQINSLGFRDNEYDISKKTGVFRILVVGDPFTFGLGNRLEETYPKQLEQLIHKARRNHRYEVWNLGVRGYNAPQELRFLETKAMTFQPDLIVIGFFANDLFDPTWDIFLGRLAKQVPRRQIARRWLKSLIYQSDLAVYLRRGLGGMMERRQAHAASGAPPVLPEDMWRERTAGYLRLKTFLSEKKIPLLIVVLSAVSKKRNLFTETTEQFITFCKVQRIVFIDPIGGLEGAIDPATGHLSAFGNRVVAEGILKKIEQKGWI